ncbi:toluene tolerance protein [Stutzerimonas balearica]|uniref:phosphotransferase n=1 Tax=Stutzerimonas balearica TaxID=74829 RepID=UPI0007747E73|nr:phosphotransferase [Stutzerimonas balearica]MCZ4128551.1 phosphotransferase [Stutzerimonas balearica]OMG65199.1 toluene tolerance protein [Stutzerimonas balearica]
MRIVTAQELENWLAEGKVLERDARGPKVLALEDGSFLKIFHTRRHPFLARLFPSAQRFARNLAVLHDAGFSAPEILETFWLDKHAGLSGCLYQPLPGVSIETLFRAEPERIDQHLPDLAAFIKRLHNKGIYFRSLHIGNIILLPNGSFGLIDVLDLHKKRRPLNESLTRRNFCHLRNHLKRKKLEQFPFEQLLKLYRSA